MARIFFLHLSLGEDSAGRSSVIRKFLYGAEMAFFSSSVLFFSCQIEKAEALSSSAFSAKLLLCSISPGIDA